MTVSNEIWGLLAAPTVLSELEKSPNASPLKVGVELFSKKAIKKIEKEEGGPTTDTDEISQDDLDRAATTGNFPHRPTDLFLKVSLSLRL